MSLLNCSGTAVDSWCHMELLFTCSLFEPIKGHTPLIVYVLSTPLPPVIRWVIITTVETLN